MECTPRLSPTDKLTLGWSKYNPAARTPYFALTLNHSSSFARRVSEFLR